MDNKKLKIIAILAIMITYIGFGFVITGIVGITPTITYFGMILYTAGMFLHMFLVVWHDNSTIESEVRSIRKKYDELTRPRTYTFDEIQALIEIENKLKEKIKND